MDQIINFLKNIDYAKVLKVFINFCYKLGKVVLEGLGNLMRNALK